MSKNIGKVLTGLTIGAGITYLFTTKKGAKTRADIKKLFDEMLSKANDIDMDDVKHEFEVKLTQLKNELETLDKEKAIKIAKKTAKEIQIKADELVDYAVLKGTPVMEKTANVLREKAIDIAEEVIKTLEKKGK